MTAQEESPMMMMMMVAAHPMLTESTKALNQAQIDGLRASRVQNRFCVKLLDHKTYMIYARKFSLMMILLPPLTFKFKKSRFRIFRVREQQIWISPNGNCPNTTTPSLNFGEKRSHLITFWALRPSFDSVSFHLNLISPGFVFTSWSLVMCPS